MERINYILLIDDDAITNFINTTIISHCEVASEITVASSGMEGLREVMEHCDHYDKTCFTTIFLDINMPVMNGFDVLEELRILDGAADHIKVFMLSSSSLEADRIRAYKFNIAGYIEKPLTEEKVNEALSSLVYV